MKTLRTLLVMLMVLVSFNTAMAQQTEKQFTPKEQELINLSNNKWNWMSEKNVTELRKLFHPNAMFVHMGGSWGTQQELSTIENGFIWYKHADIHTQDVKFAGTTGIVYSNLQMTSVVGGHEVSFPFTVSEVYVKDNSSDWQLATLIFTKLVEPEKK